MLLDNEKGTFMFLKWENVASQKITPKSREIFNLINKPNTKCSLMVYRVPHGNSMEFFQRELVLDSYLTWEKWREFLRHFLF